MNNDYNFLGGKHSKHYKAYRDGHEVQIAMEYGSTLLEMKVQLCWVQI